MEKILITGAGGFIGSHLAEECVASGFQVRAFVHYNSRNDRGWLDHSSYQKEMEIVFGDIRDFDSVSRAAEGCCGIIHLAALIGIPYSYITPLAYIQTNVIGTYNILEVARRQSCKNIIVTSTSETYGSAQYVPIDENHPLVGQSPYAASKIAADQLAVSYYRSFNLPVKIARPFNTYGPRQSARAVIPTIISQIARGQKELQLGNVTPTRDLTFVRDTVRGFLEIWDSPSLFGEFVNIGMNEEISIADLALKIAQLMNTEVSFRPDPVRVRPEKSEVNRLKCDNRKILSRTNWKPGYTLEKGLEESICWIRENLRTFRVEDYNV